MKFQTQWILLNRFCDYFTNIGANLAKQFQTPRLLPVNFFLGQDKAAGYDNISMNMIKQSIEFISKPSTHIINLSIVDGIVPDQMKIARVIPVFKCDDYSKFNNYRPISVLPAFSKLLEGIMYDRLLKFIEKYNILSEQQYGFRKGRSTV